MEKSVFRRLLYGSSGKKFSGARRSKALEFRASHWRLRPVWGWRATNRRRGPGHVGQSLPPRPKG